MIRWFFSRGKDPKDDDSPRFEKARKAKEQAEKDHQEVVELIQLLEVEHKKNHYADLVESALAIGRHKNGDSSK